MKIIIASLLISYISWSALANLEVGLGGMPELTGGETSRVEQFIQLPSSGKILKNQIVYGYSSTKDQTDSSPFITANGERVEAGGIANNCYDFGQSVSLSEEVNIGSDSLDSFKVNDRMNSRYGCEVWDIWFETREEAIAWGKRIIDIEIIE